MERVSFLKVFAHRDILHRCQHPSIPYNLVTSFRLHFRMYSVFFLFLPKRSARGDSCYFRSGLLRRASVLGAKLWTSEWLRTVSFYFSPIGFFSPSLFFFSLIHSGIS